MTTETLEATKKPATKKPTTKKTVTDKPAAVKPTKAGAARPMVQHDPISRVAGTFRLQVEIKLSILESAVQRAYADKKASQVEGVQETAKQWLEKQSYMDLLRLTAQRMVLTGTEALLAHPSYDLTNEEMSTINAKLVRLFPADSSPSDSSSKVE